MNAEAERLEEAGNGSVPWKKWGPYLSERQWATVREDYSEEGDAWDNFPHWQSVSRAYRWGEDGLGGISDDRQLLCFAVVLWNGADKVLKERLFGLTGPQGNHGEDVKEYYFYLDSTPTHSFMKYLYKYPQAAYPYEELVAENRKRSRQESEYELLDTGIFDQDRYFDVFVEYAKVEAEDLLIRISVVNRGPETASLHLLPTLWFRNTWSWEQGRTKPNLRALDECADCSVMLATQTDLGRFHLVCEGNPPLLFVDNETNSERLFGSANASRYVKDGINDYVVHAREEAVNPERTGTKAAADYALTIQPGETRIVRLRLRKGDSMGPHRPFEGFDALFQTRQQEADQFYAAVAGNRLDEDAQQVLRQALAGMLWSKQYYEFDVGRWLQEHGGSASRNNDWSHLVSHDVISMPDKWEYPWFAVWDLAFHAIALVLVDAAYAKQQLTLFLEDRYQHPNGQIPAYEWNFSDVNPPVHAWAVRMVYHIERECRDGQGDIDFLKTAFEKLERNFQWWGEHKGPDGNVYQGGFLGLDNIGVFDRSVELPTGGHLEQSDGTAWMALYAQNMIQLSLELAKHDNTYEPRVVKYLGHFLAIASTMDAIGSTQDEMWDEEDGFYYDVLRFPDGRATRLKIRSLVGLLPLCAATVIEADTLEQLPQVAARYEALVQHKAELTHNIACPNCLGVEGRRLLAVLDEHKLRRVLARMLDEQDFLGAYGIRSLSKYHELNPYTFHWDGQTYTVAYLPGESDSGMFGGNSNWRGPVWMPANVLIVRALHHLFAYYGEDFTVECPTGSGRALNLYQIAREITRRLLRIFLRDEQTGRPVFGRAAKFQEDPHWKDQLLFYEYFHGDHGFGLGAAHQTGWTGTIASLLTTFGPLQHEDFLE
jgi:hypothetical protein